MKKVLLAIPLLFMLSVFTAYGMEKHVGKIKGTRGIVSISRSGKIIPAFPETKIYLKDLILTGSDGAVGILLEDNTLISMGPISRLSMDKFDFSPAKNKYAMRLQMQQGSFVYLSGLLGKLAPHAVELNTPVGKISMLQETNFMANFPSQESPPN